MKYGAEDLDPTILGSAELTPDSVPENSLKLEGRRREMAPVNVV